MDGAGDLCHYIPGSMLWMLMDRLVDALQWPKEATGGEIRDLPGRFNAGKRQAIRSESPHELVDRFL